MRVIEKERKKERNRDRYRDRAIFWPSDLSDTFLIVINLHHAYISVAVLENWRRKLVFPSAIAQATDLCPILADAFWGCWVTIEGIAQ